MAEEEEEEKHCPNFPVVSGSENKIVSRNSRSLLDKRSCQGKGSRERREERGVEGRKVWVGSTQTRG